MRKCPKIGERVSYAGSSVVGMCTGIVLAIYPVEELTDDDDPRPSGKMLPESEWHVSVRVDQVPVRWCYSGTDKFAPVVASLRRADK